MALKKKILFVIPSFCGGGAERALVLLLKYLDRERFAPVAVTLDSQNAYADDFPVDVRNICLNKRGKLDNLRIVFALAKVFKDEAPDVIVSVLPTTNMLSVLAKKLSKVASPLLLTEQGNLTLDIDKSDKRFIRRRLIRRIYPRADGYICVSNGVRDDLVENWGINAGKTVVINNPVETERVKALATEEADHPWFRQGLDVIVSCGRLTVQKNYPLLLRAFAGVLKARPDTRLLMLGEGELAMALSSYAKELGVADKVDFLGFQKNPFRFIAAGRAFVMSSLWEGFPLVLIEAMTCGSPVISTRCPSGPEELITDGGDGLLVPVNDENALSGAILRLLTDERLRKRIGLAGAGRAVDFSAEKIARDYERLFEGLTLMPAPETRRRPPVFLVGAQRSGSTLLRLILNAHSEIAIPEDADFLKPLLTKGATSGFISGDSLVNTSNYLKANPHFKLWGYDYDRYLSDLQKRGRITVAGLMDEIFSLYAEREGKKIWGDKSPSFFRRLDVLSSLFPDARFIHIVRDGRDAFESLRSMDPSKNDPGVMAIEWSYKLARIEKALKNILPANTLTIRYEDLLDDPEKTIKDCCSVIGVSYEPRMLDFYKTSHKYIGEHHSKLIFKPIDPSNKYRWREKLSRRDAAVFTALSSGCLERYGYSLDAPAVNLPDVLFIVRSLCYGIIRRLMQVAKTQGIMDRALKGGAAVRSLPIGAVPKGLKNR